jgi:predicted AAA+ superfamily ATPase
LPKKVVFKKTLGKMELLIPFSIRKWNYDFQKRITMNHIIRRFPKTSQSFFLFGPRGTGKSTFIREMFPDALSIDLLLPDVFRSYQARPERLREIVLGNIEKKVVVIDEIQKIPELLSVVHVLIEEFPEKQFVLTGSSARKLRRAGVNLLGGRALLRSMFPFAAAEIGETFSLDAALETGLLPLAYASKSPKQTLDAYIGLYVREEVFAEGLTRNIGNFTRFLEAISFSHGGILNISNVARECGIERKTIENYVSILEDLLLAFRLPVFSKKAKRSTIAHQKFYLFDAGVFRTVRPTGTLDRPSEIEGAALEGLVATELRNWAHWKNDGDTLYYFRTLAGSEVDFIMYGSSVFWAIEVKNSKNVHPVDLKALRAFCQDYPDCKPFFLYRGKEKRIIDDIPVFPVEDFLLHVLGSRAS